MKSKLNKAQGKISHVNPRCFGSEFCEPHNEIDEVYYSSKNVKKLLSRQRKEIIKDIKNKKFERGQRQWCIQCANRICRFIEGKKLRKITY